MAVKESGKKYRVCVAATCSATAVATEEALAANDFFMAGLSVAPKVAMADKEAYGATMRAGDKFELFSVLLEILGIAKIMNALRGITHNAFALFNGRLCIMRFFVKRV